MSDHRPFRRRLLVNTASSGLANVWAMVAAIIAVPLLLRGLGQAVFGVWVLLQTFSATNGWFSLADLGVVVATTTKVAEHASRDDLDGARRTAASSLAVCTSIGLVGGVLLATVGSVVLPPLFHIPDDLTSVMRLALVFLAAQIICDLAINSLEASLEGLQRVDLSRAVDVARRTLVVVATATLALATGNLVAVSAAAFVATLVATIIGGIVMSRHLPHFLELPDWGIGRSLLRSGRAVAALRPLGVLQRTMDRLIVGVVLGPASVALVEIATQLQAGADAVLSATSYAVVPASSWLRARKDHRALTELAERGTKYSMLATIPFVVTIAMLSAPIIDIWLGPSYLDAAGLATVAVLNVAATAPLSVGSQLLLGIGRARAILQAVVVAVTVNVVMSIVLVHVVGIVGVLLATLLGTVALTPLLARPLLQELETKATSFLRVAVLPTLVPTAVLVAAIALTGIPSWGPWTRLIVSAGIGGLLYVAAVVVFSLDAHERQRLRGFAARRAASEPGDP